MFSEPAVGERFFGRQEVLDLLTKRALALKDGYRQNVALTGQSLVGKSSIILHFLQTIENEGFVPVYIEITREHFKSFSNKFIATMLYNLLTKMGENVDIDMDAILSRSQKVLPKTSYAIRHVNSSTDRGDFDDAYMNLLGLTSILKEETGMSCIVILDEFDNLEYLGVKNPFLSFGKAIMVQKDTMYIVSSSRNEAIKKIISEKLSLLFGNFEVVKISNFDTNTAGEFIDTKLSGFDIEPSLKKFLIAFTDGNPFYLERIISFSKERAANRMSAYIDQDVVRDAMLELVYNANGAIHQYLLNFLLSSLDTKQREGAISILLALAHGHRKQQEIGRAIKTKQIEIAKTLTLLLEIGLVSKNGVFYRIDDTLLEFWLKYVYQKRMELIINGTFNRTALFANDLDSYISNFIQELSRDVTLRLAELFDLFSNELVQVGSKHIKLPHFTRVEIRASCGSKPLISCSFRNNFWMVRPYDNPVTENDIIYYIRDVKTSGYKSVTRIIVPLGGIDENAKLLAKELKIAIWDNAVINMLFGLYGKRGIIT